MSNIRPDVINNQSTEEEEDFDIGEIIATLIDGKFLIAIVFLIFLSAGIAKVLLATPIYKADALLQVEEKSNSLGGLESVVPVMASPLPTLAEIEIIKSRTILGETVNKLSLNIVAKPKYFPIIGEAIARRFQNTHVAGAISEPLFGKGEYAWGGEEIQVDTFSVPESWVGKALILLVGEQGKFKLLDGEQLVLEGLVGLPQIKNFDDGDQVTLFVSLLKARVGTQFILLKKPISLAVAELNAALTVVEKVRNTGILSFALELPEPVLATKVLNELANIYVRKNVEQKSKEAQNALDFLDEQLPTLKEQLETSTRALNEYRITKGSVDLDLETQNVLQGAVEITTQITLLQQKRDELRGRFTASHPSVIAIDKQIGRLRAQMNANEQKIETLPETQQVILRLARDVKVNTELYTTLLNSAQTLRVAKAGTVGNVRIIDQAEIPTRPIKPNKPLIVGIAGILGLVVGVILVFIRKIMRHGVEDPDQVEKQLNIPVYATIPHSDMQMNIGERVRKHKQKMAQPVVLALDNKEDLAIESLRSLRTTLHFAFLEAKNNIVMITGPSPGVGKTFVSTNLAVVLADAGKKVLLIDGDLRRGAINKGLAVNREEGLSELISGAIPVEKAVRRIEEGNIDFIPTGAIPPNPSELLLHDRFSQLLGFLSNKYDHVIIDSPPVLAVTDACIIGRLASATLMVIKAGQHPMRELEQCTKRLTQGGVQLKGVVFNNLPVASSRYGYGYGYGYGKYVYSYSYGK